MAEARARVFISYARRDGGLAETVRDALTEAGYDAYLDVHDIAPGERWRERLGKLIAAAEKVVFLISPDSVASQTCDWEVNEAERQGKPVLPVVVRETPIETIPPRLRALNFLFFRSAAERAAGVDALIGALGVDLDWERARTRWNDQAEAWERAGRPPRLLIARRDALRRAEAWRDRQPPAAPPPTPSQRAFIAESRRAYGRRQGLISAGLVAVALATTAAAGVAVVQRQEAVRSAEAAERARAAEAAAREAEATARGEAEESARAARAQAVALAVERVGAGVDGAALQARSGDLAGAARSLLDASAVAQSDPEIAARLVEAGLGPRRIARLADSVGARLVPFKDALDAAGAAAGDVFTLGGRTYLRGAETARPIAPWSAVRVVRADRAGALVLISDRDLVRVVDAASGALRYDHAADLTDVCAVFLAEDQRDLLLLGAALGPTRGTSENVAMILPLDPALEGAWRARVAATTASPGRVDARRPLFAQGGPVDVDPQTLQRAAEARAPCLLGGVAAPGFAAFTHRVGFADGPADQAVAAVSFPAAAQTAASSADATIGERRAVARLEPGQEADAPEPFLRRLLAAADFQERPPTAALTAADSERLREVLELRRPIERTRAGANAVYSWKDVGNAAVTEIFAVARGGEATLCFADASLVDERYWGGFPLLVPAADGRTAVASAHGAAQPRQFQILRASEGCAAETATLAPPLAQGTTIDVAVSADGGRALAVQADRLLLYRERPEAGGLRFERTQSIAAFDDLRFLAARHLGPDRVAAVLQRGAAAAEDPETATAPLAASLFDARSGRRLWTAEIPGGTLHRTWRDWLSDEAEPGVWNPLLAASDADGLIAVAGEAVVTILDARTGWPLASLEAPAQTAGAVADRQTFLFAEGPDLLAESPCARPCLLARDHAITLFGDADALAGGAALRAYLTPRIDETPFLRAAAED